MNPNKKNKDQSLNNQLADYALFPEMNPGPVLRFDLKGNVLLANKAARELFGENILFEGKWINLCKEHNKEIWGQILEVKESISLETIVKGRDIMFTYVLTSDRDFIFTFGTDITERREAEKKIEEYARFPDMNPAPVLRLDLDGYILLANSAAHKELGMDLKGKCWREFCPILSKDNVWNSIQNATNEPYYIETQLGNKTFMFAHRRDEFSDLLFAFGADITQNKKTEMLLRQSEKMATLGTLAAGIAHELNNPAAAARRAAVQLQEIFVRLEETHLQLNTIIFSESERNVLQIIEQRAREHSKNPADLDAITRSDKESEIEAWLEENNIENAWEYSPTLASLEFSLEELTNYRNLFHDDSFSAVLKWIISFYPVYVLLNEINQSSTRISEIVRAMKSYSYLDQAPIQNINIHEGLDNTLIILRNKLKDGIEVIRDYANDLPKIIAYGSELNQVWTNIFDNSIDAMNGKGRIKIQTSKENSNIVIQIEDNGPGIPKEILSRIFDPFFTTKEPGKGTGLGLSNCYSIIVEKHKGNIAVESTPGKTSFNVTLPIAPAKS